LEWIIHVEMDKIHFFPSKRRRIQLHLQAYLFVRSPFYTGSDQRRTTSRNMLGLCGQEDLIFATISDQHPSSYTTMYDRTSFNWFHGQRSGNIRYCNGNNLPRFCFSEITLQHVLHWWAITVYISIISCYLLEKY
jgi:hypothetical protein